MGMKTSMLKGLLKKAFSDLAVSSYQEGKDDFEKGEFDKKNFKKQIEEKVNGLLKQL